MYNLTVRINIFKNWFPCRAGAPWTRQSLRRRAAGVNALVRIPWYFCYCISHVWAWLVFVFSAPLWLQPGQIYTRGIHLAAHGFYAAYSGWKPDLPTIILNFGGSVTLHPERVSRCAGVPPVSLLSFGFLDPSAIASLTCGLDLYSFSALCSGYSLNKFTPAECIHQSANSKLNCYNQNQT